MFQKRQLDVEKRNGGKPAHCKFSTWVRPGKRIPPSVKFPMANSGKSSFSGDLMGSKVANCQSAENYKK
jgi:hypothetical protein